MKNSSSKGTLGLIFIVVGAVIAMNALFDYNINLFFKGWWTFFLIAPQIRTILQRKGSFGTYFILGIGIFLLFRARNIVPSLSTFEFFVIICLFSKGFSILFPEKKNKRKNKNKYKEESSEYDKKKDVNTSHVNENSRNMKQKNEKVKNEEINIEKISIETYEQNHSIDSNHGESVTNATSYYEEESFQEFIEKQYSDYTNNENGETDHREVIKVFLGTKERTYERHSFYGCDVICILGNVQIDIRNTNIRQDVYMDVTSVLGGIDLYVPSNLRIINQTTTILANIESNIKEPRDNMNQVHTLYIRGTCVLGGIEIR